MKNIFFFLIGLSLLIFSNSASAAIFDKNFNDGLFTPQFTVFTNNWSAATNELIGSAVGGGGAADRGVISANVDFNLSKPLRLSYKTRQIGLATQGGTEFFTKVISSPLHGDGYSIQFEDTINQIQFKKFSSGIESTLSVLQPFTNGVNYDINIFSFPGGAFQFYVNGIYRGRIVDTSFTDGNQIVLYTGNDTDQFAWDNFLVDYLSNNIVPFDDTNIFGIMNVTGFGTHNGINYTNTLTYDVNYTCSPRTAQIQRFINNIGDLNHSLECDSISHTFTGNYQNSSNGNFNIKFFLKDLSLSGSTLFYDQNFISDLNAPIADLNSSSSSSGFSSGAGTANLNLTCFDSISPKIDYNISKSPVSYFNGLFDANSTQSTSISALLAGELFLGTCTDLAGNQGFDTNTFDAFASCFQLVNEQTGANLTTSDVNLFFGALTASSYNTGDTFNFKSPLSTSTCYTTTSDDTIRFDLNYNNGLFLYKEFNLELMNTIDSNVNVCIASPQDFFEQLFTSTQHTPVIVKNIISGCYSLIDYTKYALEDTLSHRAFTISMPYELTTFDQDQNRITLTIVNGAVESQTNLDVLLFRARQILLNLQPDELTVSLYFEDTDATDTNRIQVTYQNIEENNINAQIQVIDGNTIVFSQNFSSIPNQFSAIYDFTGYTINADVLKIVLTKTLNDGDIQTINRYFTLKGPVVFPAGIAAIIAFVFFLFVFTVIGWKSSLGVFGILINLATLGILTLAPGAGWIVLLQAFLLIGTVWLAIIYKDDTIGAGF